MSQLQLSLIGFGVIGRAIAARYAQSEAGSHRLATVCVRDAQVDEARALLPASTRITTDVTELLASSPDLVIEAAGQAAIREHGEQILRRGCELWILSVGALAEVSLNHRLELTAKEHGGRIGLPAGALAGFDGLMAMKQSGLKSVTYRSTKPPSAWLGTPAEQSHRLAELREPTVVFRGTARQAALQFPKNANLAAAVALAGIGFEATVVELVADPRAIGNSARLRAEGTFGTLEIVTGGHASANPKTSSITAMSILSALQNRTAAIAFV